MLRQGWARTHASIVREAALLRDVVSMFNERPTQGLNGSFVLIEEA